jgi:hypothetical protein
VKVLDLRCANGHGFEGWFGSEDDFQAQNGRGDIACPLCSDHQITRLPSAPRLNLSAASEPRPATPEKTAVAPAAGDLQAAWLAAARALVARTEDVGDRFAEEARRIHYGETENRGIRGNATPAQREALQDEGIETFAMPLPVALKEPLQ